MYEPHDMTITLNRASRIFDVSAATIADWGLRGIISVNDDNTVSIEECERCAAARQYPDPKHVRALSVLDRMKRVYTTGQIAKILGASPDLIIRLIDSGELQGYRLPQTAPSQYGGDRRVTKESLVAYLAENPGAQAASMGLRLKSETKPAQRSVKVGMGEVRKS